MGRGVAGLAVLAAGALLIASAQVNTGAPGRRRPTANAAAASTTRATETDKAFSPERVLNQYCIACHNARNKTAGLAIDTLNPKDVGADAAQWEKVVRKLRVRYMPPAGIPRPDERTYAALVSWLERSLDAAWTARPDPGRTETFRRLTRTEYRNAVRDLLALDVDVATLLPADESIHGFDTASLGDLSPTQVERYLTAARKVSRLAVGSPIRSPGGDTFLIPPDLTQEQQFDGLPFGTRGGAAVNYTFPLDAEYEIQIRLARDRNEHVEGLAEQHDVELMLDGERVRSFTVKPPPPGNDHHFVDKDLRERLFVKAGPHSVAVAFPLKTGALLETERQPYQAHFNMDRHPRPQPAVYSVSVMGPYEAKGPGETPSRRKIFVCRPAAATTPAEEDACAARILTTLVRRAWRRPVTAADIQGPLKFYREARAESPGAGAFESGIEMAVRAILVSPEFLFRVEHDPAGAAPDTAYRISDLELASRLSFFLWSSIPDDELLDAAIAGKMRTPAQLERQVQRMLADPRSEALVTNFAEQWLYLRNLASASPDMRLFPGFDDNLRRAFRRETELFFESIAREDRSVLELLRADYTFLNERLAKHYGIPGIYGSRFRRVTFAANGNSKGAENGESTGNGNGNGHAEGGLNGESVPRGGLLRHGSILTVTSYATRTSPVIRGKWVLANILGVPPPPPLPFVPALKEKSDTGKRLAMRERLAAHRDNPACSGCHKLMDPVGFALENYDAVGRWRARETRDDTALIDASGELPDGSKFEGVGGLEEALLRRPEVFAGTFTEKLLAYALGRGVEHFDAPAVRRIVNGARARDYRFSAFILGIVNSTPFQMRRAQ